MFIQSLVENTTTCDLQTAHGLAIYIETQTHKILFDLGPDDTLIENAKACNIDLTAVDTVILSHGHYDHGGGLAQFLEINQTAKIYVQKSAFLPYYSIHHGETAFIGLDATLENHPQIHLVEGDYAIDEQLILFTVAEDKLCHSPTNDCLQDEQGRDAFHHEQYLVVKAEKTALFMGCGHKGVVNIMEKAMGFDPDIVVGGFHLYSPKEQKTAPEDVLSAIANRLKTYPAAFYTCHCTGVEAYQFLKNKNVPLHYLACGDTLQL